MLRQFFNARRAGRSSLELGDAAPSPLFSPLLLDLLAGLVSRSIAAPPLIAEMALSSFFYSPRRRLAPLFPLLTLALLARGTFPASRPLFPPPRAGGGFFAERALSFRWLPINHDLLFFRASRRARLILSAGPGRLLRAGLFESELARRTAPPPFAEMDVAFPPGAAMVGGPMRQSLVRRTCWALVSQVSPFCRWTPRSLSEDDVSLPPLSFFCLQQMSPASRMTQTFPSLISAPSSCARPQRARPPRLGSLVSATPNICSPRGPRLPLSDRISPPAAFKYQYAFWHEIVMALPRPARGCFPYFPSSTLRREALPFGGDLPHASSLCDRSVEKARTFLLLTLEWLAFLLFLPRAFYYGLRA